MTLMSQLRNRKKNSTPVPLEKQDAFVRRFLQSLEAEQHAERKERHILIIARSPASPVAKAIVSLCGEMKRHQVTLQAIFAEMTPEAELAEFSDALLELQSGACARDHIRWARNRCLKDAHEQLILGTQMCWSGDCMRREPGKCNSLDLFEENAADAVRLGILAFDAIWSISETVSESRLRAGIAARPSASYAADPEDRLATFSFLRKSDRANPLAH